MTKKIYSDDEERYEMFEIYETKEFFGVLVSDKLFEKFNKIQCLAQEMRDFIDRKISIGNYKRCQK